MPFDLDVLDADWRSQLSEEQLDAIERRRPIVRPPEPTVLRQQKRVEDVPRGGPHVPS